MAYEYESITNGIFSFTIPGENKTVKLFFGDKVIVQQRLSGSYLNVLKFVGEIDDKPKQTKKSKQTTKVEDKITSVTEEVETKKDDNVSVEVNDKVEEVIETPKKRGRRKRS